MKQLLTWVALLCVTNLFGQIQKGDKLLGGTFGINFSSSPNSQYSQGNTNISPLFQWAYKANRTLGFAIGIVYSDYKNDGNRQQQFGIVPEVNLTQYHPVKGKWGWYLQEQLGAGYQSNTQTNSAGEKTESSNAVVYGGVRPGVYVIPGEASRWLIFGSVGGAQVSYTGSKDGPSTWGFDLSLFKYYQFGFALLLTRRP